MGKFESQYTPSDFIKALDGGLKTAGYIAKTVGCVRATAMTYLNELEKEGKVEKFVVDDGQQYIWKLKNTKK